MVPGPEKRKTATSKLSRAPAGGQGEKKPSRKRARSVSPAGKASAIKKLRPLLGTARRSDDSISTATTNPSNLRHPKEPAGKPWPLRDLRAYNAPKHLGWGKMCDEVLRSRGWTVNQAPCHCTNGDDPAHTTTYGKDQGFDDTTTVFLREFEASLRGLTPLKAFGKKGSVQEGYPLKARKLPSHALWFLPWAPYRVPGTRAGQNFFREDFVLSVVKHGQHLPGEAGNYRISCFPGTQTALWKTSLSEAFGEKSWFPKCYVLPQERKEMLQEMTTSGKGGKKKSYWITKPRNGEAGSGIRVWEAGDPKLVEMVRTSDKFPRSVVQRYLADPLLVGGYKFHMRIHLAITNLQPLKAFVQINGQCLFATKPYTLSAKTLGENFDPPVHVTNMGLNATEANKENFLKKKPVIGPGQQIRVRELEEHLSKTRPGSFEHAKVWAQITTIARETAEYISKSRAIRKHGSLVKDRHFELLGMDLMLDNDLKVWMCETNPDPGLDFPDQEVYPGVRNPDFDKEKNACLQTWHDYLSLLGLDAKRKQTKGSLSSWYEL